MLLAFFDTDSTARPWYVRPTTTGVPVTGAGATGMLALSARPVPAVSEVRLIVHAPGGESWRLEIVDPAGRRLRALGTAASDASLVWDLRDDAGRRVAPGVYWARVSTSRERTVARVVIR